MKSLLLFILDVSVAWVLVVGGMAVGGSLTESRSAGCILLPLGLLPALLYMKFRVPESWGRFVASACGVLAIGVILWTLYHFGLPQEWRIAGAFLVVLVPAHVIWLVRKKKERRRASPSAEDEG